MRVCGARRLQTVVNKARSPKLWRLCGCPHMIRRGHWLKRPVAIGIMVQVSALVLILGADCVLAIMHVRRIHLEAIDHHLDELLEELVLSIGTCSPTTCRRPALLQGFLPPRVCTRAEVKEQLGSTMRSVSIPSCARCAELGRPSLSCQRQRLSALTRKPVCQGHSSLNGATQDSKAAAAAQRFGWSLKPTPSSLKGMSATAPLHVPELVLATVSATRLTASTGSAASRPVIELPVDQIRRPLSRTRSNSAQLFVL